MKLSNHKLTYVELYPEPLENREPSGFVVILGAFAAAAAVYLITFLAFSL